MISNITSSGNNKKDEIKKLKNKNNDEDNSNPKDIIFLKNIVNDSYPHLWYIDQFTVFKSINNILCLIYANKNKSIISYNIIENKKLNEIKNAHQKYINKFRYYLDNINKRDLIISISSDDNNLKLWHISINNTELILNINNIYNFGYLESACFLINNNESYIITCNISNQESIKVFDFKGNKIKEINDSKDISYFIDIYCDNNLFKNYIITGMKKM